MDSWTQIWSSLPLLGKGLLYTVLISLTSFAGALVMGTVLGLLREEPSLQRFRLKAPATLYIETLRGVPLILFLLFMHYGLLPRLMSAPSFLISSLIAFTLFEAAYIAEIVRSGLKSVTAPERDAARSLGLSDVQQLRLVVLPLALSRIMPALVGQFISLVKDTSLASIVGVIELTRAGEIIYEQTYREFEILLLQAAIYFILCYSLSRISRRWEVSDTSPESLTLKGLQS